MKVIKLLDNWMVQIDIPLCTARFSPHQAVQVGAVQMRTTACHRMALRAPQSEEPRTTFLLLTCGLVTNFCHGCTKSRTRCSHNLSRETLCQRLSCNTYGSLGECQRPWKPLRIAPAMCQTHKKCSGAHSDKCKAFRKDA